MQQRRGIGTALALWCTAAGPIAAQVKPVKTPAKPAPAPVASAKARARRQQGQAQMLAELEKLTGKPLTPAQKQKALQAFAARDRAIKAATEKLSKDLAAITGLTPQQFQAKSRARRQEQLRQAVQGPKNKPGVVKPSGPVKPY